MLLNFLKLGSDYYMLLNFLKLGSEYYMLSIFDKLSNKKQLLLNIFKYGTYNKHCLISENYTTVVICCLIFVN